MNYGYVKVAAAVPRVKVADCKFNADVYKRQEYDDAGVDGKHR